MEELIGLFLDETPKLVENVRRAWSSRDLDALQRAAHALKGTCANLGARPATRAALGVESAAREGDIDGLDDLVTTLVRAVAELRAVLGSTAGGAVA
jgi:HPt (histidine-containing phosphotransfer) domain-containing protein